MAQRWRIDPAVVLRPWAAAACLSLCGWAWAAGLSTTLPNGQTLGVVETSTPEHAGFSFERRYPDGTRDRQFGSGGRVFFSMGGPGAAATTLRADASGRLLVAGFVARADGTRSAVVARFQANGQADTRWGVQGLASLPAASGDGTAADVLPSVDGSLLVVGAVDAAGTQRAAAWRIDASGQPDSRFGQQGVLLATALPGSRALSIVAGPDGAVQIAVQTAQGGDSWIEVHRWRADDVHPLRVARQKLPEQWLGPPELVLRQGQWFWVDPAAPDSPLAVVPLPTADSPWAPPDEVQATPIDATGPVDLAALNPYAAVPTRVERAPVASGLPASWFAVAAVVALMAGALLWRSARR